jgi:hypothetical protein
MMISSLFRFCGAVPVLVISMVAAFVTRDVTIISSSTIVILVVVVFVAKIPPLGFFHDGGVELFFAALGQIFVVGAYVVMFRKLVQP